MTIFWIAIICEVILISFVLLVLYSIHAAQTGKPLANFGTWLITFNAKVAIFLYRILRKLRVL